MKRFVKTGFFLALKDSGENGPPDLEQLYEEFTEVVMDGAGRMDHAAYCHALNFTSVELKFMQKATVGMKKNLLSAKSACSGGRTA
ncbi:MAG: hypothetical protein LBR08_12085 [Bacteroidales bacterium]|jgi:hypothetical protein|nr:hypothetical protein [Bacteroidales bacterium]